MRGCEKIDDTEEQVLRLAVEEGYFKVPRETTLIELSEQLGMSDVETSKRLRRAVDQALCDSGFVDTS